MATTGDLLLLGLALACLAGATCAAVKRVRVGPAAGAWALRATLAAAFATNTALLVWRASERGFHPPTHNFDSTVLFTSFSTFTILVLSLFRRLRGVELFFLPVVVFFQIGAYLTRNVAVTEFTYRPWFNLHALAMILGSVCFALGCAGAGMYLLAARRLRNKQIARVFGRLPSLETSEKLSWYGVSAGFAMLTFGILSGLCQVYRDKDPLAWVLDPKVLFAFGAWLGYLIVLLARLTPRWRGRRAALLSVAGFVLFAFMFVLTDLMSKMHP